MIRSTIPVLASLDIDASVEFYTKRLGFEKRGQWDDYAIVSRDGAEIHFWRCAERRIAENTSCYLRAANTHALHAEFRERGLSLEAPSDRPWGMRELHVIDPHGNLLKFGESVLPADGAVPPIADTIRPDGTERPARRNETRSAGDLQIRPYRDADEAQVVDLWERCALLRPWNDPRKDIARKQRVQPDLFLVGTIGETVVAVVMTGYDGHRGWVNYLAVDPTLRRQGFAAALMSEAERRLRDLGCAKVNLQIRRDNTEAIAFYERIGFAEDAVRSLGKRLESDWPR